MRPFAKLSCLAALVCLGFAPHARAQAKIDPPVPIRTSAPPVPKELQREGFTGIVMLKVAIDEKGDVTEVQVEKSTAPELEAPALAAMKKWKFRPAQQEGQAIAVKVSIPIRFVVSDGG